MMILVTGGARSGKSRHAEALIADFPQVLYIATSQIFDDEMAARIQHHRDGRPAHWRTAERWQHLDALITADNAPEMDHIVALSNGGPHVASNVQCLCRRCNHMKAITVDRQPIAA